MITTGGERSWETRSRNQGRGLGPKRYGRAKLNLDPLLSTPIPPSTVCASSPTSSPPPELAGEEEWTPRERSGEKEIREDKTFLKLSSTREISCSKWVDLCEVRVDNYGGKINWIKAHQKGTVKATAEIIRKYNIDRTSNGHHAHHIHSFNTMSIE